MQSDLRETGRHIRRLILKMAMNAGGGHVAPSLSCVEILVGLYHGGVLRVNPESPDWPDRDRFILSKGHAGLSLYAVLADMGFFPIQWLDEWNIWGGRVGGQTHSTVPGVELSTGALGHGLSVGAGMALAAERDGKTWRTFVLLGDGECQEGSIWEAAAFAGHHKLGNLTAIIDRNELQALATTEEVMGVEPLVDRWHSFGWCVTNIDGHDPRQIKSAVHECHVPQLIIAHTVKGKGLSFMENIPIWHFRIPEGREIDQMKRELDG
jgi:transketolase